ncbi:hypothetical protein PAPYR_6001 [Paratrimastix pyriformis]|uniref:Uncharacterized protein n=1 Tax=Paratrimastix pyriformis TaxID=342808 RepID=A0ABQ8UIR9_9EUKA|nr:hypothetical protein PAPYR_6001 [Paratrimastix pyriformis]
MNRLTDGVVGMIPNLFPHLQSLVANQAISRPAPPMDAALRRLAGEGIRMRLHRLEFCCCNRCELSAGALAAICRHHPLRVLKVGGKIEGADVVTLPATLRKLSTMFSDLLEQQPTRPDPTRPGGRLNTSLRRLTLTGCPPIKPPGHPFSLGPLLDRVRFGGLARLRIDPPGGGSCLDTEHWGVGFPKIASLTVRFVKKEWGHTLCDRIAQLPNLRTLRLESCHGITSASLQTLAASCPMLRSFHLTRCGLLEPSHVAGDHAGHMRQIRDSPFFEALMDFLRCHPDLRHITTCGVLRAVPPAVVECCAVSCPHIETVGFWPLPDAPKSTYEISRPQGEVSKEVIERWLARMPTLRRCYWPTVMDAWWYRAEMQRWSRSKR